jgi:hypothetical protein
VRGEAFEIDFGRDDIAHLFLELVDGERAIEDDKIIGVDHFVVLRKDARLKELEAFGALVREAEVHASFIVFEFGTAAEDALDGDVERRAEIKSDVRDGREAVEIAKPAASGVAGESGIDVTICEDEIIALKEGHDLALAAIGEIGSVQERKGSGSKEALLLAATGGGFDEGRRVPLSEMETVAADFEPTFEEIKLCTFTGAVSALNDDKSTWIRPTGNRATGLRKGGFGGFGARCL